MEGRIWWDIVKYVKIEKDPATISVGTFFLRFSGFLVDCGLFWQGLW